MTANTGSEITATPVDVTTQTPTVNEPQTPSETPQATTVDAVVAQGVEPVTVQESVAVQEPVRDPSVTESVAIQIHDPVQETPVSDPVFSSQEVPKTQDEIKQKLTEALDHATKMVEADSISKEDPPAQEEPKIQPRVDLPGYEEDPSVDGSAVFNKIITDVDIPYVAVEALISKISNWDTYVSSMKALLVHKVDMHITKGNLRLFDADGYVSQTTWNTFTYYKRMKDTIHPPTEITNSPQVTYTLDSDDLNDVFTLRLFVDGVKMVQFSFTPDLNDPTALDSFVLRQDPNSSWTFTGNDSMSTGHVRCMSGYRDMSSSFMFITPAMTNGFRGLVVSRETTMLIIESITSAIRKRVGYVVKDGDVYRIKSRTMTYAKFTHVHQDSSYFIRFMNGSDVVAGIVIMGSQYRFVYDTVTLPGAELCKAIMDSIKAMWLI